MKRVLVTGSRGFVGSALKKRLLSEGYEVLEMDADNDVAAPASFSRLEEARPAHVFHLAGKTFVPESWQDPLAFYNTNVTGTMNVLDFCRRNGASLTYVSAYLYGVPERLPIPEDAPIRPNNPYAHSKYLAEQLCEFYAREFNVRTTVVRPFNVFGPGQAERFLIPFIIRQAIEENEIRVKDLAPKRDYVYIDDLVDALVVSMGSKEGFAVYNVGSGYSVSVGEVISAVQDALGTDKPVVSENEVRKNEINDVVADISKAARGLGWRPAHSFKEGVKKIIEELGQARLIPINKGNYSMETPEREELFERHRAEGWEREYREYRKNWTEFARTKKVSDYPLLVDAELASICNLKCPMCYTITDEFKNRVNVKLMDFELFKKIIDEIGGHVPALRLSLRGEPMLHPRFTECVRYAKERGIKEVSFLTNGSRLTGDFFTEVMEAGADWITISVDGLDGVYESIRKPLKFDDTLRKLKEMKRIKDGRGAKRPVVKAQSVWPAIRENPGGYYNTLAPHVDLVAFNPLIDYLGKDTDIVYEEDFSCPQHYQRLVIGADGLAMMCSNDEEGSVIVGDANTQTVHGIWHGEKLNSVRELHRKRGGFKEMAVCRRCYLPRKTEDSERASVNGREFIIKNYVNRRQEIGR